MYFLLDFLKIVAFMTQVGLPEDEKGFVVGSNYYRRFTPAIRDWFLNAQFLIQSSVLIVLIWF